MKIDFCSYVIFLLFITTLTQCGSNYSLIKSMKYNFNFYTAYHQFYISDSKSLKETNSKDFWDKEAYKDRLASNKDVVAILTKSYGNIKGELEVLDKEKAITNFDLYDHIVEVGIEIKSGKLQILDCPNSNMEEEVTLIPGIYRIRVYSQNLDVLDGEDEEEGNDFYRIEIWKDKNKDKKILKRYGAS